MNAVKHYPVRLDTIKLKRYIANSNALDDSRLEELVSSISQRQRVTEDYQHGAHRMLSLNLRSLKDRDITAMSNYDRY